MPEHQEIEWKESWRDEYLKWLCGYANAHGGTLFIGKDDDGKVTGWSIELPYTPFTKDEVNVEVKDHSLVVTCGTENKTRDEHMDFSDISYQMFSFSIPLSDNVDVTKISAIANDGMLRIELPAKAVEEKKPEVLKIEVK